MLGETNDAFYAVRGVELPHGSETRPRLCQRL